jgi:ribose/xylose/arabinose/galactoside ABC-type transport system permease subunit
MSRGQSVDLPSLEIDPKTHIDPNLLPGGNQFLGNGDILGLPIPLLLIILSALLCWVILNKSVIGRSIYAVGGNPQAARFAGIDERKVLFFIYTVAGALTGLAAMIEVSRGTSAQPNSGADYPLDSIAAVVIGGGSLLGGVGNISGTIIGALVIAVLRNGSNLLGVDPFLQMVFIGVLIIAAVALDQWQKKA